MLNCNVAKYALDMPAAPQKTTAQAQPWKKNWPPATAQKSGEMYGVEKGGMLEVDGGGATEGALMSIVREEKKKD